VGNRWSTNPLNAPTAGYGGEHQNINAKIQNNHLVQMDLLGRAILILIVGLYQKAKITILHIKNLDALNVALRVLITV